MNRYSFAPRTTQEILASLEIETQQNLVDSLHDDDHMYKLKQLVPLGSFTLDLSAITYRHQGYRFLHVTVKDIVELRAPSLSVAHRIDVKNPSFFPVRLCYSHGKQYLVHTDEELKQQPAGAAPTPLGPWPAGFGDPWLWKWDRGKGLYAPAPYRGQYDSYAPGGTNAVWATQSFIYYRQAIPQGAIFLLEGGSEDRRLDRDGSIQAVESWAQHTVPHHPTGWWFIDQPHLEEYKQRYETVDLTGFDQFILQPPDAAHDAGGLQGILVDEGVAVAAPTKGGRHRRSQDTEKLGKFLNNVKTIVNTYRKHNSGEDPTLDEIWARWPVSEGTKRTWERWGKDAAKSEGFQRLKDFVTAIPR